MVCCHYYAPQEGGDAAFSVDVSAITFGRGCLREAGDVAAALGIERIALMTDKGLAGLAHVAVVREALIGAGLDVVVYDEVDTGIGGTTANIVGRNLRTVAARCQVLCVTHSPQVASAGDAHLLVSKATRRGGTETEIHALDEADREAEIARMLGAEEATASSVAHARDLIATAGQAR